MHAHAATHPLFDRHCAGSGRQAQVRGKGGSDARERTAATPGALKLRRWMRTCRALRIAGGPASGGWLPPRARRCEGGGTTGGGSPGSESSEARGEHAATCKQPATDRTIHTEMSPSRCAQIWLRSLQQTTYESVAFRATCLRTPRTAGFDRVKPKLAGRARDLGKLRLHTTLTGPSVAGGGGGANRGMRRLHKLRPRNFQDGHGARSGRTRAVSLSL